MESSMVAHYTKQTDWISQERNMETIYNGSHSIVLRVILFKTIIKFVRPNKGLNYCYSMNVHEKFIQCMLFFLIHPVWVLCKDKIKKLHAWCKHLPVIVAPNANIVVLRLSIL